MNQDTIIYETGEASGPPHEIILRKDAELKNRLIASLPWLHAAIYDFEDVVTDGSPRDKFAATAQLYNRYLSFVGVDEQDFRHTTQHPKNLKYDVKAVAVFLNYVIRTVAMSPEEVSQPIVNQLLKFREIYL